MESHEQGLGGLSDAKVGRHPDHMKVESICRDGSEGISLNPNPSANSVGV
jgi:hypothetical protein